MKDTIKRIIHVLVAAAVLVICFSCSIVSADETEKLIYPRGLNSEAVGVEKALPQKKSAKNRSVKLMAANSFEDYVVEQCMQHSENIEIYDFNIPITDIINVWYNIVMKYPEIPVSTSLGFDYYPDEPNVFSIYPKYLTDSLEEDERFRITFNNGIDELISCADNCGDTLGKLLLIHDEIIKNCEYDMDYLEVSHNAFAYFENHKMVCQGYSQLYCAVCRRLGVEVGFCRSEELQHLWNYVCVDGKWYHLDITWDDPVVTSLPSGQIVHRTTAKHNNFLMSDATAEIEHGDKSTWISSLGFVPDCDDTFESRHIFNLPYDLTVEYDGKMFKAPYSTGKTNIYLTSRGVYTGEIITSELTKSSTGITQYYYCFDDISANLNFMVLIKSSDGGILNLLQTNKGSKNKDILYSETYRTRNVPKNAEISFMYWKERTMTPFTAKKSIIN